MKSYSLKTSGNSRIAAAYAAICAPGGLGARFIESGFSQAAFTAFIAEVALRAAAAGMDAPALTAQLEAIAACNASQARQAMESLSICYLDSDGKPVLKENGKPLEKGVAEHWTSLGTGSRPSAKVDLGIFGLGAAPEQAKGGEA